jgi:hypothetical protein
MHLLLKSIAKGCSSANHKVRTRALFLFSNGAPDKLISNMGLTALLMGVRKVDFLNFVAKLGNELYELFQHSKSGVADPELEKQIAMRIVRKAITEQAKEEINGD